MQGESFADFVIPDGMIEITRVTAKDVPPRDGESIVDRMVRIVRYASGSKYEIVGTPLPPPPTSAYMPEAELAELREAYDERGRLARAELIARVAARTMVNDPSTAV